MTTKQEVFPPANSMISKCKCTVPGHLHLLIEATIWFYGVSRQKNQYHRGKGDVLLPLILKSDKAKQGKSNDSAKETRMHLGGNSLFHLNFCILANLKYNRKYITDCYTFESWGGKKETEKCLLSCNITWRYSRKRVSNWKKKLKCHGTSL